MRKSVGFLLMVILLLGLIFFLYGFRPNLTAKVVIGDLPQGDGSEEAGGNVGQVEDVSETGSISEVTEIRPGERLSFPDPKVDIIIKGGTGEPVIASEPRQESLIVSGMIKKRMLKRVNR